MRRHPLEAASSMQKKNILPLVVNNIISRILARAQTSRRELELRTYTHTLINIRPLRNSKYNYISTPISTCDAKSPHITAFTSQLMHLKQYEHIDNTIRSRTTCDNTIQTTCFQR